MYGRIIDESNPRYRGPLPKPRGLLPVPPEIAEEISRDQAAHQPNYTDDYAKIDARRLDAEVLLRRRDGRLPDHTRGRRGAGRRTGRGRPVLRGDAARGAAGCHDPAPVRRQSHEPSRSSSPIPDAPGYGRYRTLGRSHPEPQDQPRRLEGDSVPSRFRDRNDDHAGLRGQEAGLADPEDTRCRAWSCTAKRSVPGCSGRGSSAWTRPNSSFPATSSATRTFRLPRRRGTSWD